MPGPPRTSVRVAALAAGYAITAAIAFGPALSGPFASDDYDEIWKALGRETATGYRGAGSNIRPLHLATLWIDAQWGSTPLPFRITGLGIHVVNALLVVALASALRRRPVDRTAVLAGAAFLLAPSRTEAVSWIAARADLLVTTGVLIALVGWLRSRQRDGRWATVASFAGFAVALASKEAAIIVPVLIAVVAFARADGDQRLRKAMVAALPYAAAVPAYLAVRWWIVSDHDDGYRATDLVDGAARWPLRLVALVIRSVVPALPIGGWIVVLVLALLAVTLAVTLPKRSNEWRLGALLIVLAAVAAAPHAALGVSPTSTMGERLTYLPGTFTAIVLALVLGHLTTVTGGRVVVAAVLVAALVGTFTLDRRWATAEELAGDVVGSMSVWPRDTSVILLGVPNDVRGTVAARDVLPSALSLRHGWTNPQLVAYVRSYSADDASTSLDVEPDGPGRWRLTLRGGRWLSADVDAGDRPPEVRFSSDIGDTTTLGVTVDDDALDRVWYYSDGRMHRLADER